MMAWSLFLDKILGEVVFMPLSVVVAFGGIRMVQVFLSVDTIHKL